MTRGNVRTFEGPIRGSGVARDTSASATVLSALLTIGCTIILLLAYDQLRHWFILPTTFAGILVGVDLARWAIGELDTMHPRALVGIFGFHMVYVVPLAHVALGDVWPLFVRGPSDWEAALGTLSIINMAGLIAYRLLVGRPSRVTTSSSGDLDPRIFKTTATFAVLIGAAAFVYNVISYGGPSGYIAVLSNVDQRAEALAGTGWLLLIAESWPLVLFTLIVVLRREALANKPLLILLLLLAFTVAQFAVGGLRGSRANTVWPLLIGLGVVHLAVRPVRRRMLALGAVAVLSFSWVYGVYKAYGQDTSAMISQYGISQVASNSNRSGTRTLLEDFGRAGIQAVVIDRAKQGVTPRALGETYLGAGLFLIPDGGVPFAPRTKVEVGTEFLYGPNSYSPRLTSSRIYGLVGEGILNFGLWFAPMVFVPFAWLVRRASRLYERGTLASAVQAPILAVACILTLGSDLDNVIFFLIKHGAPLLLIVSLSRRTARATRTGPWSKGRGARC